MKYDEENDIARIGRCVGMCKEEMEDTLDCMNKGCKMGIISILTKSSNGSGKLLVYWSWPMVWEKIEEKIGEYIDSISNGEWIKVKDTYLNPNEVVSIRPNLYKERTDESYESRQMY